MIQKDKIVFLHVPKTGGGAMSKFFYREFNSRRNYYLSFFGHDHSTLIQDKRSTPQGNQCVIEKIFIDDDIQKKFKESPHFQEAKLLLGHTTYAIHELFPEYNFEYMAIIREPIERTISNIRQFSTTFYKNPTRIRFGTREFQTEECSEEFWDLIYNIISTEYPIKGFAIHENLFLRNVMTHMLGGSKFDSFDEKPNLEQAIENSKKIHISLYNDFNMGLQRNFDKLGVRINMRKNIKANSGIPESSLLKKKTNNYYNAPQKLLDLLTELNQEDIQLYEKLTQI